MPEVRDSIFNPYFTTKDKGEGTGLGLAVVHGIVKNLEGEITVDSEKGKGSIFDVYLPVIEDEEQVHMKPLEPLHIGHENVLLVDDEPGIVEMGRRKTDKPDAGKNCRRRDVGWNRHLFFLARIHYQSYSNIR